MVRKFIYGIVGISALMFSGCSSEESMEKYKPIVVESEGVVLTSSLEGLFLSGDLSPQGGSYIFTPKSDVESRIQSVEVDGESLPFSCDWASAIVAGEPVCSGEWGEIAYLNEESPYEIGVTVNGNSGSESREIKIFVQGVYEMVTIELVQAAE